MGDEHGARQRLTPPSTTQRRHAATSSLGRAAASSLKLLPSPSAARRCTGALRCPPLSLQEPASTARRGAVTRVGRAWLSGGAAGMPGERRGEQAEAAAVVPVVLSPARRGRPAVKYVLLRWRT
ncbi:hypothetical protein VPH35_012372 [Triticum aestivum]